MKELYHSQLYLCLEVQCHCTYRGYTFPQGIVVFGVFQYLAWHNFLSFYTKFKRIAQNMLGADVIR